MRKLAHITANILPPASGQRSYGRRRVRAVLNSLTCICLVKHGANETQLLVSDDGDAVGAIWLNRGPLLVDPKDRGPFLVVTMTRTLAQQKGLAPCILDWDRYTPEERVMLKDAIEAAKRTRQRLNGQTDNRPTWSGGRNVYA